MTLNGRDFYLNGRDFYLGKVGSPKSRGEFDRLMAEWLTHCRRLPDLASGVGSDPSVDEMLLANEAPVRRPRTTAATSRFPAT